MAIPVGIVDYLAMAGGIGLSLFAFKHFEEAGRFSFAGISIMLMSVALAYGYQTSPLAIVFSTAAGAMLALIIVSTFRQIVRERERAKD